MRSRWRVVFGLVVLLSVVVLFAPDSEVPTGVPVSDKAVHLGLFLALAATGRLAGRRPVPLLVGLVGYAGVSELLQAVLPLGRDGDVWDAVADLAGAACGLALVAVLRGYR